jgi:hypothetical protein
MGDHTTETLRVQEFVRYQFLDASCLNFDEDSHSWISKHIDCFVRQSRGNSNVKEVNLCLYTFKGHDDGFWDKVGQAVGNLEALERLTYWTPDYEYHATDDDYDDEVVPIPDSEIIARILSYVRQTIRLEINYHDSMWHVEESRSFARAIHGHPTIWCFEDHGMFPYEASDALYSALATLPTLELINLSNRELSRTRPEESALANPESLTELLRAPSLRSVCFREFDFTPAFCQALANALMEGTAITKLEFTICSFSTAECAGMMANGLGRNTSVSYIIVDPIDQTIFNALATALPSNSTLRRLDLIYDQHSNDDSDMDLSPVLLALGKNTGLKKLSIDGIGYILDESLCTAMQNGLGMNTTLEYLILDCVHLTDDNSDLWCRAISFLRTNKALKSLMVDLKYNVTESRAAAFRSDVVAMLQDNVSLENLTIGNSRTTTRLKEEEYVGLIIALLLHNTTLKSIDFQRRRRLSKEGDKQVAVLLKKNYALESLPDISQRRDVGAILRLNKAGRRYLVQDGSSVLKGVKVLSAVSDEINCVFLHLLENPRLCDRSAVEETASASLEGSRESASPANPNGKRKQDQTPKEGKETRRRRA